MSGSGGGFADRGVRWLAAAAGASLILAGALATFPDAFDDVVSAGADGYSRSAIGHHAFLTLLRELGFEVVGSRHATAARGVGAVIVVAEPAIGALDLRRERLKEIHGAARRLLVVLPKRTGTPINPTAPWIAAADLVPLTDAQAVLDAVLDGGRVIRPAAAGGFRGPLPAPGALDSPQLVVADALTPLVEAEGGLLAGELVTSDLHLVVLADPDPIETHGLGDGEAALLAVRLLERLGAGPGALPVVVDETLHGHEASPSIARELLRWPIVLATIQAAFLLALLAWRASVRFGRPQAPPGGLAPGRGLLVANTADLMRQGGHTAAMLQAYFRTAKESIARALRPPGERADPGGWLVRIAATRGRDRELARLEREVAKLPARGGEAGAIRLAVDIHRFREEIVDGAGSDPERG